MQVEPHWQKELAMAFTDPELLLQHLRLSERDFTGGLPARKLFPMRVPRPFVAKMQQGNPDDPLLLQVITQAEEFQQASGFSQDPLQEQDTAGKGLMHKYRSRVLLIVRGGCAINCRYCFRRHFPYADNSPSKAEWQEVLEYIAEHPEVNEVILSGGDPLMAKDDFLGWLVNGIEGIAHVRRLRIHTRLPVVIPQRITPELMTWFVGSRLNPVMVLHINHGQELDQRLVKVLQTLKQAGVTLLNQAVLLKGVNDNADALEQLSEALFSAGVLPYYLHQLDKVAGASHFEVSDEKARNIMGELIKRLPGYLVPKLVREIGGQPGKTPIDLQLHP